ncbi:versicolorin B synthase [Lecanosticta acicola]|uniref:Versicolorin B synthase n=1 Tax=Lecanosticta acicola TaxID=111012 RepID=A0AAI9EFD8_9PEZI|nr:versicolorin B synthase [Lecanosticta acicola]
MLRGWAAIAGITAVPAVGIYASLQQQQILSPEPSSLFTSFSSSISSTLGLSSTTEDEAFKAEWDGRIQSDGLLSSKFGMYGWPKQSFDYVIVGGGTAGLAMARRLSEDGSNSVAVIEAGGFYEIDGGNATEVPMYLFNYFLDNGWVKNPLFDWYQYTVPQPGLANRSMFYMSGKTLGGSSARGAMLYHRGSKGAYQKWADHVGDQSYTWDKWLPYFQKSVKFSDPTTNSRPANATAYFDASAFAEGAGPVHVAYPHWTNAISSWVDKTFEALGIPLAEGFSNGNLLGRSYITHTIHPHTRRRETSSSSYLREALLKSQKLNIFTRTIATKVLFDESKKATGVSLNTDGFQWKIAANKEVIVSAGVMRSPQLLMASGVGPEKTLEPLGIDVLADRPGVGQNMWDTIILGPTSPVGLQSHSQLLGSKETLGRAIYEYNTKRSGLLTNPGQDYFAFEKHHPGMLSESTAEAIEQDFPADWPTFSYIALDDSFVPQWNGQSYFSMSAVPLTPFSRGTVTINSSDVLQHPVVDPKWLADPRDRELVVAAFRRCRQFVESAPLRDIITGPEILPGTKYQSDEEIYNYIAETSDAFYAGVGTCAMGKIDDPLSVVDTSARVIGVQGLRVVDASAFPFSIDGQPMGTIYALAEKIAAEMLAERQTLHENEL